jgi:hypothetical protein
MGRKTINIQKLEQKIPRMYSFVQRKRGILKKAIELSVLCDKEIYFVILDKENQ